MSGGNDTGSREPSSHEPQSVPKQEYEAYALRHDASGGEGPDVLLDVPVVKVDEIDLEVEDLRARVSLQTEVLELLKLNVGADVMLGRVKLQIKGVEAQALLKVRLDNVSSIVDRVLTTIDRNPQLLEHLTEQVGQAVDEVGEGTGEAVGEVGEGAGQAAGELGESASQAVEGVGEGAGQIADNAGDAAGQASQQAGQAIEGASHAAEGATEGATQAAGQAAEGATSAGADASEVAGQAVGGSSTERSQAGERQPKARQGGRDRRTESKGGGNAGADIVVEQEFIDDDGNIVSRGQDKSGRPVEQLLDDEGRTLATSPLHERAEG